MKSDNNNSETERLEYLKRLEILDSVEDPDFNSLVHIASEFFDAPISLVSLVDSERQWFKAKTGLVACSTAREYAFCAHAILSDNVFIVEDALCDERFKDNPLVTGEPNIRFYAGAPLIMDDGIRIGTFCIIDSKPRKMSDVQIQALRDFSAQAVALIKLHIIARRAKYKAGRLIELNKEISRAETIIENMSEGMTYQDRDGDITVANPSACTILGLTHDQFTSYNLKSANWRVTDENERRLEAEEFPAMIALHTGIAVRNIVIGVEKPDGGKAWINVSAQPVFEDGDIIPSGVVTTFSDVTAAKALENELRIKTSEAQIANKTKSKFLANMSHEIRTPLNGVIGIASVLKNTSLDEKQKEMVDLMLVSGKTLERLLSDILDISKVEAGQFVLESEAFNLFGAINDIVGLMQFNASEKNLDFKAHLEIDENLEIKGDILRFKQIISNLSANAIKFTDSGEIMISARLIAPDKLELKVTDTGIGMSEETLANVFNRFTQADASISRRFGGSGLGLSISKGLVELMGGTISATSNLAVGTCFTIELPIICCEGAKSENHLHATTEDIAHINHEVQLLLIEDHLVNQKVFKMMVENLGINVTVANNGLEGVEAFKSQKFDIVFMDIQMPIMDGLEATRLIREIERRTNVTPTPIVALSANAGKNHVEVALGSGADDYLTKPIDFICLTDKLAHYLYNDEDAQDSQKLNSRTA